MGPEIIAGILCGVALGMISGVVPGIHANTMAGVLLAGQGILLGVFGPGVMGAAMFAALVTHTFLDILPSTFLGIPDADTALSVLPAHALCLEGRGAEAVRISALGSAYAVAFGLPLFLLFFYLLPSLQPLIDWWIGVLLIAVAGLIVVYSDSPGWSFAVFLVSGCLGLFTFHYSYLAWNTLGGAALLMPLLAGLFGVAVLLRSTHGTMPPQRSEALSLSKWFIARHSLAGTVAGALVGWLPGLSNATANALLSFGISDNRDPRGYIIATSAANTANAFLALAALYAISRTRNGVMVALLASELPDLDILLISGVAAAIIAYLITIRLSMHASVFNGIPVRPLSYGVCGIVVLLTAVFCGPFGLLILSLATLVGFVPQMVNVRRVACMGAVMVPVISAAMGVPLF